jgi:methenyltetrahydromethanopterin cyclohydrolase
MISLNNNVKRKLQFILDNSEALSCKSYKLPCGANIVDMGVEAKGSFEAARLFTEINMADLGTVTYRDYVLEDGHSCLAVEVMTSEPILALRYSQIASYPIGDGMIGSGPGRAVARNKEDYCFDIPDSYRDVEAELVVLGVQGPRVPDDAIALKIAEECNMTPDKIYLLVHNNTSIVAAVQVAARILEQTLHKIMMQEEQSIEYALEFARGFALVAPVTLDDDEAMGKINDSLLYGGRSQYWVKCKSDEEITRILPKLTTDFSKDYGRSFRELYLEADRTYYKMDLNIHSPARVEIFNMNTGNIFSHGNIREDIISSSFFKNKRKKV